MQGRFNKSFNEKTLILEWDMQNRSIKSILYPHLFSTNTVSSAKYTIDAEWDQSITTK